MLLDAFEHGSAVEIVEREDGFISASQVGSELYLAPFRRWPSHHRQAMRFVRGRVLDIGAGGGRVAMHLQERGQAVVSIDVSPGAIEVCRRRGVKDARELGIDDVDKSVGPIDTIVMLGNNFGLFGTPTKAKRLLRRLHRMTSDDARIIAESHRKERVFTNPMEPARISAVMLLKRNFDEDLVIERLSLAKFMARLLVGRTPTGTKEIVYNSYRAVDDKSERAWIDTIEAKGVDTMWDEYLKTTDKPVTLEEELEMFRMLHRSAKAYDVNTILQKDPKITGRMEAVTKTMRILVKALETDTDDFHYDITSYEKLLS